MILYIVNFKDSRFYLVENKYMALEVGMKIDKGKAY